MDRLLPDLRGQLAALMSRITPLDQFLDWFLDNLNAIEIQGSDDVSLLNRVFHLYAEYTSANIGAAEFLKAL